MTDLILRVRQEVLNTNIKHVREKLGNLGKVNERYATVEADLQDIRDRLNELPVKLETIKRDARHGDRANTDEIRGLAGEVNNELENLIDNVASAARAVKDLAPIPPEKTIALTDDIVARQETCDNHLAAITNALASKEQSQAWRTYLDGCADARRLLSEYVEFISGLALRDAGMDEGICAIADELSCVFFRIDESAFPRSIALPAREETIRLTCARVLRIGFPEWTIWALPLTAHDLWFVMPKKSLLDFEATPPWVEECLADAFGVWSTGPAYAYAAFCLRLDPSLAYHGNSEHAAPDTRAYAILKMWELMDMLDGNHPYHDKRAELEQEWEEVLRYANRSGECDQQARQRLDEVIPKLFERLNKRSLGASLGAFRVDTWHMIQEWPKSLLNNNQPPIELLEGAELRLVLNAAWLARIQDPSKCAEVAELAKKLCEETTRSAAKAAGAALGSAAARHIGRVERGSKP